MMSHLLNSIADVIEQFIVTNMIIGLIINQQTISEVSECNANYTILIINVAIMCIIEEL